MDKPTFGTYLRNLREKNNLSLREVARRIGVSASYLSDVENDRRTPPGDENLLRLATIFDIQFWEIFYRAGKVTPFIRDTFLKYPETVHSMMIELIEKKQYNMGRGDE